MKQYLLYIMFYTSFKQHRQRSFDKVAAFVSNPVLETEEGGGGGATKGEAEKV